MSDHSRDLAIFKFQDHEVRSITRAGEPWFVLADVCKILDIGNPRMVAARIPDRHKTVSTTDGIRGPGNPNMTFVSKPGLYRSIFMSRKPEAEAFIDWITEEVLPAIEKTGKYMLPENDPVLLQIRLTDAVADREAIAKQFATVSERLYSEPTGRRRG